MLRSHCPPGYRGKEVVYASINLPRIQEEHWKKPVSCLLSTTRQTLLYRGAHEQLSPLLRGPLPMPLLKAAAKKPSLGTH